MRALSRSSNHASVFARRRFGVPPRCFSVTPATIPLLLESQTAARPDSLALIAGQKTYSYSELYDACLLMAAGLRELGYQKGDMICQSLPSCAENVVLQLGACTAGVSIATAKDAAGVEKIMKSFDNCKGIVITREQAHDEAMQQCVSSLEGSFAHPSLVVSPDESSDAFPMLPFSAVSSADADPESALSVGPRFAEASASVAHYGGGAKGLRHTDLILLGVEASRQLQLTSEDRGASRDLPNRAHQTNVVTCIFQFCS